MGLFKLLKNRSLFRRLAGWHKCNFDEVSSAYDPVTAGKAVTTKEMPVGMVELSSSIMTQFPSYPTAKNLSNTGPPVVEM